MESTWLKDSKKKEYPKLKGNIKTNILIVGGGIGGISLAYELSKVTSQKIVLVEQNLLYHATTGYTTGKLTAQHGYRYQIIIKTYGVNAAKLYYDGNMDAINTAKENIKQLHIDCDFLEVDHVLYASKDSEQLRKEREAYEKVGAKYVAKNTQDYQALVFPHQAVFHVVKYLDGLLDFLNKKPNVEIYENSRIVETKSGDTFEAIGDGFSITADKIIFASMYPMMRKFNFYFIRLKPVVSFVCAAKVKNSMNLSGINEEGNVFSFRPLSNNSMLFAGYSDDSSSFPDFKNVEKLKEKAKNAFEVEKFDASWLNQDFDSLDELPLIGKVEDNMYMMTGYNKWGLTTSILASKIISDLVMGQNSKYSNLFKVKRYKRLLKRIGYVLGNPITYIRSFLRGKSKKCTHLYCSLRKNNLDGTYECPCHGSRFKSDGTVIIGPAKKNLS